MKVSSFFKNKYVLYILLILGSINLLGYISMENYNSMALFVVLILLSRYFSKNTSLNILLSVIITGCVTLNNNLIEGFKEGKVNRSQLSDSGKGKSGSGKSKGKDTGSSENKKVDKSKLTDKEKPIPHSSKEFKIKKETRDVSNLRDRRKKEQEQEQEKEKEKEKEQETEKDREKQEEERRCSDTGGIWNGEICLPGKRGFRNNVPPSKPASITNDDEQMDVAAKMEDAYGNLNKMLGDGAMKSMANETKKLVAQQQNLMNTLHSMTPTLNKARETLDNLKLPNMEQMTTLLKKFT